MIVIELTLFLLLVLTALAIIGLRDLFAAVMLSGLFSLVSAGLFLALDAPDVAFTEAAVGAGISTFLMLAALGLTRVREKAATPHFQLVPFIVVIVTGSVLMIGTLDMPGLGDPTAPAHGHVATRYIQDSPTEIGIPNMVTSVLASYRGLDTLGETAVVFTAAVGVLILLRRGARPAPGEDEEDEP